ncbi:YmfQ family protein [Rhizobium sp. C1]|uniref:YmfQ family protein n=1 Tax=Rhizobium sp. C1 TaxID=1349799 RepID=UPI001E571345|nr:putative phage tail protein [Rhizobium sp. C1]MCD2176434.1 DUF2313 domain-containing protein [Rhizobium sp. C1]
MGGTMRTVDDILRTIFARLPRGFAVPKVTGGFGLVMRAFATVLKDAEDAAAEMMDEIDPRTTVKQLADFERVLGPDPAGRDRRVATIGDRQRLAHQRWTAKGGQSIPYYIGIAAKLGVTITIDEFWPTRAGMMVAGTPLIAEGEQFTWRVNMPALPVIPFRAGQSQAGESLAAFSVNGDLEKYFHLIKPAHSNLIFNYPGA